MTIRVVVVEDHPATLVGLRDLLKATEDMELTASTTDGAAARALAADCSCDVVLLDVQLPNLSGAAVARQLQTLDPAPRILVYSAYDDPASVRPLLEAGVAGYVLKTESLYTLLEAIRAVAQGRPWYSPAVQAEVLSWARGNGMLPTDVETLTTREREVLRHLAQGASNREIAMALNISINTVARHVSNILAKLGGHNRVEVALRAVEEGWLPWI
jgi:DNA-binding NarL/FixJ family response regulator